MKSERAWGLLFAWLLPLLGCVQQQYGQCEEPNEQLEVLFKARNLAHPFSHSFCMVCNTAIQAPEYGAWALEMGAPEAPGTTDGLEPCLYVYEPVSSQAGIDSLDRCVSLVCDGDAQYSDMVSSSNGNFDLDPLLRP